MHMHNWWPCTYSNENQPLAPCSCQHIRCEYVMDPTVAAILSLKSDKPNFSK